MKTLKQKYDDMNANLQEQERRLCGKKDAFLAASVAIYAAFVVDLEREMGWVTERIIEPGSLVWAKDVPGMPPGAILSLGGNGPRVTVTSCGEVTRKVIKSVTIDEPVPFGSNDWFRVVHIPDVTQIPSADAAR